MSLRRRASKTTVDGQVARLPAGAPAPTPAPAPAPEVEPLGEAARGRRSAREAFLADSASADSKASSEESPDGARDSGAQSEEGASVNTLSWEQLGELSATLVDVGGRVLGPLATRKDRADVWPLSDAEKEAVAQASTPVLKQYLGDTEVSPLGALVAVLVGLYLPRTLAALSAPPAASSTVDAPAQPAPPATPASAPPAPALPMKAPHDW